MNEREKIIQLWFEMWLTKQDLGIDNIFTEDVIYTESWSPQYNNRQIVKHWFQEWNTRGKVVVWEIKQFFHKENTTIVEWYFKNEMNNGNIEEFDGISLVEWTKDDKIKSLKEFGCNLNNYNPYEHRRTGNSVGYEPKRDNNTADFLMGFPTSWTCATADLPCNNDFITFATKPYIRYFLKEL